MTNPNDSAVPFVDNAGPKDGVEYGFTKREAIAKGIMEAMAINQPIDMSALHMAATAVARADALIAALNVGDVEDEEDEPLTAD
jgi:hypothetical protein